MVRENSIRIRRMFNKAVPDDQLVLETSAASVGKPISAGTGAPSNKRPPPPPSGPPPREKGSNGTSTWQSRRKQSFAAVFGGPATTDNSIQGYVQTQARDSKKDVKDVIRNLTISKPYEVEHKLRVQFDEDNIRFVGVPDDWAKEAHKQFGVPLHACPRIDVPGYEDRIPLVLCKLKQRFGELNGYETEGIFRLAPDGEDCADVKLSLNTGQALASLGRAKDPHVVANLIKQFFRELKPKILCSWTKEQVEALAGAGEGAEMKMAAKLISELPQPQKSTFLWLLDLLADVAAKAPVNKMNWGNLAIVMSPNLYDAGEGVSPMDELMLSQKVAQCTSVCLKWRIQERMG